MGESYAAAGVDIDAGEEAVRRIGPAVRSTFTESVLTDVGGFGAPFALDTARFTQPVLVSSTDGVGTKLLVAEATGLPVLVSNDSDAATQAELSASPGSEDMVLVHVGRGVGCGIVTGGRRASPRPPGGGSTRTVTSSNR